MSATKNEVCERCGLAFFCQPDSISDCHCTTVSLSSEERGYIAAKYKGCLCNSCLREVKREYESLAPYYFEKGCMVMTEKYHLQRGNCCGSGCRHCPYKKTL